MTVSSSSVEQAAASSSALVVAYAPASLSNLGPGFDALGLCIAGLGDSVEAFRRDDPGIAVEIVGRRIAAVPTTEMRNTASVAAGRVLEGSGAEGGLVLRLRKGIPLGSGIGGSAASAVAGAWAANAVLGGPLPGDAVLDAALDGEAVASGSRHGDNVLPSLLGGLVLCEPSDPRRYRRVELPDTLRMALLLPSLNVLTSEARELLPAQVSLRDAAHNAAQLALLVDALRAGDWADAGRFLMADRLVEPVRSALVPCYDAVRDAALKAGAYGAALSGSGPAMFAICGSEAEAERVATAMIDAAASSGVEAQGHVTQVDHQGVRLLDVEGVSWYE